GEVRDGEHGLPERLRRRRGHAVHHPVRREQQAERRLAPVPPPQEPEVSVAGERRNAQEARGRPRALFVPGYHFVDVNDPAAPLYPRPRHPPGLAMVDTPILRTLSAALGADDTAPDGELLRRFAEADDRTAFELVVRRHAELVWGVCRAALPRDPHAAE